jgi:ATP-dependent RNA helicase DDX5/DBP2
MQVGMLAEEQAVADSGGPPMPLTVVFVERKAKCDDVASALCQERIPAVALHGGLGQVCVGVYVCGLEGGRG